MKILYIWIEEYGIIKEQGFVTNSEYNIKGKLEPNRGKEGKDKFTLCIEKNENYIMDFFNLDKDSDNNVRISDITAIIGENGAGKSTFLNFIKNNLIDGGGGIQFPAVIVLKDGKNKIIYHHESIEINLTGGKDFDQYSYGDRLEFNHLNESKNTSFIFYSNIFDYVKWEKEWGENYNISTNYFIKHDKKDGVEMKYYDSYYSEVEIFRYKEIKRQLDFVNQFKNNTEFTKFKLPELVQISVNPKMLQRAIPNKKSNLELNNNYCDFDDNDVTKYNEFYPLIKYVYLELKKYKNQYKNKQVALKCDWYMAIFNSFFYNYDLIINLELGLDKILVECGIISEGTEEKYFQSKDVYDLTIFQKVIVFFESISIQYEQNNYIDITNWIGHIIKIIKFIEEAIDDGHSSYFYNTISLNTDDSDLSIFNFIELYDKSFNFIPFLNFDWSDMSSGQKSQLSMFSRFFYITKKNDGTRNLKDDIIILIDEGELYYHPQWQKEFIKTLIYSLKKIYGYENETNSSREIQIILTSNSPFVASDLPTKNIVFLKKENGKCKVIDGLQENMYTFGANIHTLLSDSFFMNDGLIGSFAKHKIDNLVKSLINDTSENIQKRSKEINSIIAMIGEPIIRNKINKIFKDRMYDGIESSTFYSGVARRINQLEKEIQELKNEKWINKNK